MSLESNLIILLRMFKNRPNHLAKFLLENGAFRQDFLKKIESNNNLEKLNQSEIGEDHFYFTNISEMKSYFMTLIEDNISDTEEIKKELEKNLIKAIMNEDYEEAARIRDFILLNKLRKQ